MSIHEGKGLRMHIPTAVKKTDSLETGLVLCEEGGQREGGGLGSPCPPQMPAQPVRKAPLAPGSGSSMIFQLWPAVLKREFYLWLNPQVPGIPRGQIPVCSQ